MIEDEPVAENGSPVVERFKDLLESGKLIVTPHCAYLSERSLRDVRRRASEEVARVLKGRTPKAWLNPLSMKPFEQLVLDSEIPPDGWVVDLVPLDEFEELLLR